jgi:hypothetical protein
MDFVKKWYGKFPYHYLLFITYAGSIIAFICILGIQNSTLFENVILDIVEFLFNSIIVLYLIYKSKFIWKPKLVKHWSKDLAKELSKSTRLHSNFPNNLSIDTDNRVCIGPLNKTWQEIYDTWPEDLSTLPMKKDMLGSILNIYIYDLQHWLITNVANDFYLWYDEKGVNLILTDPNDKLIWKLTWNNEMPTPIELRNVINASV